MTPHMRYDDTQRCTAARSGIIGLCTGVFYRPAEAEHRGNYLVSVLGIALLLAAVLLWCTTVLALAPSAMLPAEALEMPPRYVIVTLPNPVNPPPVRVASTPRGYYNVSPYLPGSASQRASHSIAASYRLREVSSWPIPILGVNCILYALPADADLGRLLAALARDARVKYAQPLFEYAVESDLW
jgi:hypothetical protein